MRRCEQFAHESGSNPSALECRRDGDVDDAVFVRQLRYPQNSRSLFSIQNHQGRA